MAFGRPTEYDEDVVANTYKYIESCQDTEEQVISGQSDKFTAYTTKIRVKLPTVEGLALYLKFHKDTLYEWEKIHQDFSDALHVLRGEQFVKVLNSSLSGDYNPVISKLILMKHGYVDKNDTPPSNLTVTISGPPVPEGE